MNRRGLAGRCVSEQTMHHLSRKRTNFNGFPECWRSKSCRICKGQMSCCRGFQISCVHQETKQWNLIPFCLSLLPFIFLPLYGTQCCQQHYLLPLNKFSGVLMTFTDRLPSKSHGAAAFRSSCGLQPGNVFFSFYLFVMSLLYN